MYAPNLNSNPPYRSQKIAYRAPKLPKIPTSDTSMPEGRTFLGVALENKKLKASLKILVNYLKANNLSMPSIPYDINQLELDQEERVNQTINEHSAHTIDNPYRHAPFLDPLVARRYPYKFY